MTYLLCALCHAEIIACSLPSLEYHGFSSYNRTSAYAESFHLFFCKRKSSVKGASMHLSVCISVCLSANFDGCLIIKQTILVRYFLRTSVAPGIHCDISAVRPSHKQFLRSASLLFTARLAG